MREGLPRARRFHLPFTAVLTNVAGLGEIGVVFAPPPGRFLAVRAEFAGRGRGWSGHKAGGSGFAWVVRRRGRAVPLDAQPATRLADNVASCHFHFDRFRPGLLALGQMHPEHAILELGIDL